MKLMSYTANAMPVDLLATLGARASADILSPPPPHYQGWNIPSPASEELIFVAHYRFQSNVSHNYVISVLQEGQYVNHPR